MRMTTPGSIAPRSDRPRPDRIATTAIGCGGMRRLRHLRASDAAAITALGLHALQHRGQEAAGIVSFDGKRFHSERRMGLVGDNFSRREVIERLPGMSAMGHVRYSTTGETILRNVQPLFAELDGGGLAIGHNGNLTNGLTCGASWCATAPIMQSTSDTEVILHLVASAKRNRFIDRFIEGLRQLEGAYAFVGLTNKKLIGARDPLGIRPLVIGKLDGRRSSPRRPARSTSSARNTCATWRTARSSYSTKTACSRTSRSRRWRRAPASSSTSISRARIRSSAAATSTTCARPWAPSSRARRRPPPTW